MRAALEAQIPQSSPWCGWVLSTGTWCCFPQLWPQRDAGSLGCAEGLGQCHVQNSQELQQDVLTGKVFIRRDLGSPTAGGMPVPQNSPGSHRVPFHQAAAFYHFNFIFILFFSNVLPYSWPMAAQHHERVPGQAHATHQGTHQNCPAQPGLTKICFFFFIYI